MLPSSSTATPHGVSHCVLKRRTVSAVWQKKSDARGSRGHEKHAVKEYARPRTAKRFRERKWWNVDSSDDRNKQSPTSSHLLFMCLRQPSDAFIAKRKCASRFNPLQLRTVMKQRAFDKSSGFAGIAAGARMSQRVTGNRRNTSCIRETKRRDIDGREHNRSGCEISKNASRHSARDSQHKNI